MLLTCTSRDWDIRSCAVVLQEPAVKGAALSTHQDLRTPNSTSLHCNVFRLLRWHKNAAGGHTDADSHAIHISRGQFGVNRSSSAPGSDGVVGERINLCRNAG